MILGIDLGTSNTVAATISRDGTPVIIPDANDRNVLSTPSLVLLEGNKAYAGAFAENLFELYPQKKVLSFFKRYFGTGMPVYTDERNNNWYSEGLAALLIKKIVNDAEMHIHERFSKSVITVPAHYNDVQRKSVFEAARLADLELTAILDEPVAAALYYGSENTDSNDELTLVYDFGGGTFDLTLITQSDNHLHVIAKDGIEKLGGKEFDEIIARYLKDGYQQSFLSDFPINDPLSINRLGKVSEQMKIEINNTDESIVSRWLLFGKKAFECRISTEAYRQKALPLVEKTGLVVQRCLRSMGLQLADIQKIILIGGTSSSKLIYNYWLQKTLNTKTSVIYHQPLNSVAKGAAIYAGSLSSRDQSSQPIFQSIELKSVSTYNIGVQVHGTADIDLLIHRNTPLPIVVKRMYKIESGNARYFSMDVYQYWEQTELQQLGTIQLHESVELLGDFVLEVSLENKANGTIGLKVKNLDTAKDVHFSFIRKQSRQQYNYQEQRNLVDSVFLNNYIY